ncbi:MULTISPECIES: hypothetical protein [unclassified Bradyrhizobium]|uniref:hypothetical protein n=1 Tax=unclassified Bradyrhizobium TaxID=2631580 RepID=UPI002916768D|nr:MULTISPECIES: hypothetical protein [unclassified Bradyrhizobium]
MKNNVIIKMGASRFDVIVKGADGKPVVFDLYHMDKEQRRTFHREFMKAWRGA